MTPTTIHHDFSTGRISGARVIERIGMELMRGSAFILAPLQFTGFSWAARAVRSVFKSERQVQVKLADDSLFEYPYGDGYWGVLLNHKIPYAPEVESFLKSFADIDYAFIDCGSNFGYMSVLVSSEAYGSKPSIAIEADPDNYEKTAHNARINNNRYDHRHNAIFSKSGETLTLYGAKHEACSLLEDLGGGARAQVETLALNDLTPWLMQQGNLPTILKLDIEGVEIEALKGADKILQGDCLINYEEHGADKTHEISRYLKDTLGMRLYLGDNQGRFLREITSWQQLDKIKKNPRWGYDLFAASSSFWLERLDAMVAKPSQ